MPILGGYKVELEGGCVVAARDLVGNAWTAGTGPRLEVRDGYIVFAEDPEGKSNWSADAPPVERLGAWRESLKYRRAATHALVLGAALVSMSLTGASALTNPVQQQHIEHSALVPGGATTDALRSAAALAREEPALAATPSQPTQTPGPSPSPTSRRTPGQGRPIIAGNGWYFPWGYCTWWVASKRSIPWGGSAIAWYPNARAMGFAEGSTPKVGAVMVTRESSVGHVAYVESVDPSGAFTVSEMNFEGFGIVSKRSFASVPSFVVGFIY